MSSGHRSAKSCAGSSTAAKVAYYRVAQAHAPRPAALRSERKFRALLESSPDAMVIVNWHGHIALINAQAERLFGYRRKEIVGQGISELIPERFRAHHRQHMKGYMRDATTRPMGAGLELFGRHKDGSEFPIEISLSPLETDEGLLVSAAIRDVSARKRAVAELAAGRGAVSRRLRRLADRDGADRRRRRRRPRQRRAVRPHRAPRRRAHRLALRLARAPRRDRLRPQGDHARSSRAIAASTRSRRASSTSRARRSGSRCRRR